MKTLITWMGPMLRQRWRSLWPACVLALVTAAAAIGLLGVSGWFLTATALVSGILATFNLFVPSAMVRALAFIRILSRYGERVTGHAATLQLLCDLRKRVFTNLLRLDPGQLARWRDGDLVARLTSDIDALDSAFLLSLLPLLVGGVLGTVVVSVLACYLPLAALAVALLWLCLWLLAPLWLARRVRRSGAERQEEAARLRQQVLQAVEGHADLLALDAVVQAQAGVAARCNHLYKASLSESRTLALGLALALTCAGLAMFAVVVAGAAALRQHDIGGALFIGCVLAVAGLFEAVALGLRGASRLGAATAAAQRVREIEQAQPDIVDPAHPVALDARGTLTLRQVHFRHHEALPLLEGIDLEITPGSRVVVTGISGSGKSSLLALLLRLRDPQRGAILWNGVALCTAALADLYRRVALLPQDPPVFLGSVRDNLRMGDPQADEAALWKVLCQVGLEREIRLLPDGLDQWLGEGGRTLSVGQARRLCLARVLLSDAALIVLDEPTEGLDPDAERAFFLDLPRILRGRSLLLVTHAMVPPGVADACWQLHEGRLSRVDVLQAAAFD